jgi:hypothetical protein
MIYTVAEVLDTDPTDLPPLERTISADALNELFHDGNHPPGAYTVFPYCDLWVMVHSNGTVDIFQEYTATSAAEDSPEQINALTGDEQMVVLHSKRDRHTFSDDELDHLHEIINEADDCEEAWEEIIDYANQQ